MQCLCCILGGHVPCRSVQCLCCVLGGHVPCRSAQCSASAASWVATFRVGVCSASAASWVATFRVGVRSAVPLLRPGWPRSMSECAVPLLRPGWPRSVSECAVQCLCCVLGGHVPCRSVQCLCCVLGGHVPCRSAQCTASAASWVATFRVGVRSAVPLLRPGWPRSVSECVVQCLCCVLGGHVPCRSAQCSASAASWVATFRVGVRSAVPLLRPGWPRSVSECAVQCLCCVLGGHVPCRSVQCLCCVLGGHVPCRSAQCSASAASWVATFRVGVCSASAASWVATFRVGVRSALPLLRPGWPRPVSECAVQCLCCVLGGHVPCRSAQCSASAASWVATFRVGVRSAVPLLRPGWPRSVSECAVQCLCCVLGGHVPCRSAQCSASAASWVATFRVGVRSALPLLRPGWPRSVSECVVQCLCCVLGGHVPCRSAQCSASAASWVATFRVGVRSALPLLRPGWPRSVSECAVPLLRPGWPRSVSECAVHCLCCVLGGHVPCRSAQCSASAASWVATFRVGVCSASAASWVATFRVGVCSASAASWVATFHVGVRSASAASWVATFRVGVRSAVPLLRPGWPRSVSECAVPLLRPGWPRSVSECAVQCLCCVLGGHVPCRSAQCSASAASWVATFRVGVCSASAASWVATFRVGVCSAVPLLRPGWPRSVSECAVQCLCCVLGGHVPCRSAQCSASAASWVATFRVGVRSAVPLLRPGWPRSVSECAVQCLCCVLGGHVPCRSAQCSASAASWVATFRVGVRSAVPLLRPGWPRSVSECAVPLLRPGWPRSVSECAVQCLCCVLGGHVPCRSVQCLCCVLGGHVPCRSAQCTSSAASWVATSRVGVRSAVPLLRPGWPRSVSECVVQCLCCVLGGHVPCRSVQCLCCVLGGHVPCRSAQCSASAASWVATFRVGVRSAVPLLRPGWPRSVSECTVPLLRPGWPRSVSECAVQCLCCVLGGHVPCRSAQCSASAASWVATSRVGVRSAVPLLRPGWPRSVSECAVQCLCCVLGGHVPCRSAQCSASAASWVATFRVGVRSALPLLRPGWPRSVSECAVPLLRPGWPRSVSECAVHCLCCVLGGHVPCRSVQCLCCVLGGHVPCRSAQCSASAASWVATFRVGVCSAVSDPPHALLGSVLWSTW